MGRDSTFQKSIYLNYFIYDVVIHTRSIQEGGCMVSLPNDSRFLLFLMKERFCVNQKATIKSDKKLFDHFQVMSLSTRRQDS